MRFTLTPDDDVVAAVEHLCRKRQVGLSEVVNQLIRSGLAEQAATPPAPYPHRSAALGIKVDLRNVAEVLELLDERELHRAP